jgi:hypothetical protein
MSETVESLKRAITSGDKSATLKRLDEITDLIPMTPDLVIEMITPSVITELHELLIKHLEINPRLMMLRHRVPAQARRALMFVQAMRNGVNLTK